MVTASAWFVLSMATADGATTARAVAPSTMIDATVAADGTAGPASEGGWEGRQVGIGRYELSFPHRVDLAIRTWDQPAGVTIRPIATATWLVSFDADGAPVDTAFTFRAAPASS